MQVGLHIMVVALTVVVATQEIVSGPHRVLVMVLAGIFLGVYFAGGRYRRNLVAARVWLGLLTVLWLALVTVAPLAVYLVFGLFFLYLHLLPRGGDCSRWRRPPSCRSSASRRIAAGPWRA